MTGTHYLPEGLPVPRWDADELSRPYWEGLVEGKLKIQRCAGCESWQWGPEWICHRCRSFDLDWVEIVGEGVVYTWTRVWHPVHPALNDAGPYIAVLVELPRYGNIRMLGNLLGDPEQAVAIGTPVSAVFEHHPDAEIPHTLLQWRLA